MNKITEEIINKITSDNKDVLIQSMKIIDEHLNKEIERGKSAEARVNMLITLSGIASAIILFFGEVIMNISGNSLIILVYFVYSTIILFLMKSIYYSVRSLRVIQAYRLTPDLIYDIQEKDYPDSLRHEISWKIWEYKQKLPVNTHKLFWFNRGQRNLLFGIISFLILASVLWINKEVSFNISDCWEYILGGITILFACTCDFILDRFGFWHFE